MIKPSWSFAEVLALNALQNSMMLTPCGPSAVPTGGAGVAFPAGICNFTMAFTFLAILLLHAALKAAAYVISFLPAGSLIRPEWPGRRSLPARAVYCARH